MKIFTLYSSHLTNDADQVIKLIENERVRESNVHPQSRGPFFFASPSIKSKDKERKKGCWILCFV